MPWTFDAASRLGGEMVIRYTNASSSMRSFNWAYAALSLAGSVSVAPTPINSTYFWLLNAELFRSGLNALPLVNAVLGDRLKYVPEAMYKPKNLRPLTW